MRVRLMETNCDQLISLADRVEKQAAVETEPPLIELGKEIEYRRDNVTNVAKLLKGNIYEEFKKRAWMSLDESVKAAKEGRRKLDDLRQNLSFTASIQKLAVIEGTPCER